MSILTQNTATASDSVINAGAIAVEAEEVVPGVIAVQTETKLYTQIDDYVGDYWEDSQIKYFTNGIKSSHLKEWLASGVDEELIRLNVETLYGFGVSRLLQSEKIERLNNGSFTAKGKRLLNSLDDGGWWCSGVDPSNNWQLMDWGCLKPDCPRFDSERNRPIKYEHPQQMPTQAFFLRVPRHIWQRIADRYNLPKPESGEFWEWVLQNKLPITIAEGAKKAGALLSAGYVAVGLPSHVGGFRKLGYSALTKHELIPELRIFEKHQIYIALDQDEKPSTVNMVNASRSIYAKLFQSTLKCNVKILMWHHSEGKGVDDLIVNCGEERLAQVYADAMESSVWQVRSLFELTYKPDILVNSRRFGVATTSSDIPLDIKDIPRDVRLLCFRGVKGTGKSYSISDWLKLKKQLKDFDWVLIPTHRIVLGKLLADLFGSQYVSQVKEADKLLGYVLCFESMHPKGQAVFSASDFHGKGCVILDECEQSLWSLLNSSTCEQSRMPILKEFRNLIRYTLRQEGEGTVILSDADLSDVSINLIRKLAEWDVQPFLIVNKWKPTNELRWKVKKYTGKDPSKLVENLVKAIGHGEKPFIVVGGQRKKSRWSTQNLESYLQLRFPNLKILRIDSSTTHDPTHSAFECVDKLNQLLCNYDIAICSPSIETGVSIELEKYHPNNPKAWFTSVWAIAQGSQSVSGVLQSLARIRESIPRHLWVRHQALNNSFVGNGASNPQALYLSQQKKFLACLKILRESGFEWEEEQDVNNTDVFYQTWIVMSARHNASSWNYAEFIYSYLEKEGHQISDVQGEDDAIKEELKEVCVQQYNAERETTSQAARFRSKSDYQDSKNKIKKTPHESMREHRFEIEDKYASDCNADFVLKDDNGWHPQIQLHYYLTVGRNYLPDKDRQTVEDMQKYGDFDLWKPSLTRRTLGLGVAAYDSLGLTDVVKSIGKEFTNLSPEMLKFSERMNPVSVNNLKTILGISVPLGTTKQPTSPINRIKPLLHKLGLTLKYTGRRSCIKGSQEKIYELQCIPLTLDESLEIENIGSLLDDGRNDIYQKWLTRDADDKNWSFKAHKNAETPNSVQQSYKDLSNNLPCTDKPCTECSSVIEKWGARVKLDFGEFGIDDDFLWDEEEAAPEEIASEEPEVTEIDALTVVDEAIKAVEPMWTPDCDTQENIWKRRLTSAVALGTKIAEEIYLNYFESVESAWELLTDRVQSFYLDLFAEPEEAIA